MIKKKNSQKAVNYQYSVVLFNLDIWNVWTSRLKSSDVDRATDQTRGILTKCLILRCNLIRLWVLSF